MTGWKIVTAAWAILAVTFATYAFGWKGLVLAFLLVNASASLDWLFIAHVGARIQDSNR